MKKGSFLWDMGQVVLGLVAFALGTHLTILANIGLAPWDCLGMGIAHCTPLSYGMSMSATCVVILIFDHLLHEHIGFGTIVDSLFTGNLTGLLNDIDPLPACSSTFVGLLVMTVGMAFMALGMSVYMDAGRGCGPRDALLVGLGKRFRSVPIGAVELGMLTAAVLVGWLLGGKVGVGTLFFMVVFGPEMQLIYKLVGFEPRDVRHRSVPEDLALLRRHAPAKKPQ